MSKPGRPNEPGFLLQYGLHLALCEECVNQCEDYIYQFAEGGDGWSFEKTNGEGLFLAAFMLLGLPLLEIAILFFPIQLALRTKGWKTILLLLAVFGLEFGRWGTVDPLARTTMGSHHTRMFWVTQYYTQISWGWIP